MMHAASHLPKVRGNSSAPVIPGAPCLNNGTIALRSIIGKPVYCKLVRVEHGHGEPSRAFLLRKSAAVLPLLPTWSCG